MELEITQRKLGFFVWFIWVFRLECFGCMVCCVVYLGCEKRFSLENAPNIPENDGMLCFGTGLASIKGGGEDERADSTNYRK